MAAAAPRALPAALALALAAGLAVGCVPSPGPFTLREAAGRVVDARTGEPVADALVMEWYRGGGVPGASQPVYQSRWTRTGAQGRFAFERALATSPRMWWLRTYGPSYDFYHPRYGLVRGPTAPEGTVVLRGTPREPALQQADLAPFCRGAREGRAARKLAEEACPPRPSRPAPPPEAR